MKFSNLTCDQEPNNIITEEEININAMGQGSVRQPKNHVIFFWLNDSLLSWPFYLEVIFCANKEQDGRGRASNDWTSD